MVPLSSSPPKNMGVGAEILFLSSTELEITWGVILPPPGCKKIGGSTKVKYYSVLTCKPTVN